MLVCIEKYHNNSEVILGYLIQNTTTGEMHNFESAELKKSIKGKKLKIDNLIK